MTTVSPLPAEHPGIEVVELWPPQPPRAPLRRRVRLTLALIPVGLAALTAAVIALLTPGGQPAPASPTPPPPSSPGQHLDHRSAEREIEQWGYRGVVCNQGADMPIAVHRQFSCHSASGQAITITITTPGGDYVWAPLS
jgi:hypothetical protein